MKKSVSVKDPRGKKHTFELNYESMGGVEYYTIKKNSNIVIRLKPKEYKKLYGLFIK